MDFTTVAVKPDLPEITAMSTLTTAAKILVWMESVDAVSHFECICNEGYYGDSCEKKIISEEGKTLGMTPVTGCDDSDREA